LFAVIEFVHGDSGSQVLSQSKKISVHTRRQKIAFISQFGDLGSVSGENVVSNAESGISSNDGIVFASDS